MTKDDSNKPSNNQQEIAKIENKILYSAKLEGITFINEKDFKNDKVCKICNSTFGQFSRRHHCRLCAQSICAYCSMYIIFLILYTV